MDCHRVNATVVGPSWLQIADLYKAASYEETKSLLIGQVKKGSSGNWITFKGGTGMPPMARRVSDEAITQFETLS